jgi:hypothetical protein
MGLIQLFELNFLNLVDAEIAQLEKNLRTVSNQTIVTYGGMANGVGQMVSDIKRIARPRGLKVLRIWSHGYPGGQAVSVSPGVNPAGQMAGISMSNYLNLKPDLTQVEPYFAAGGRAELRGCNFSAGSDGIELLTALAKLWKVDVYGAVTSQPIGPIDWVGPVTKITPRGDVMNTSGIPIGR